MYFHFLFLSLTIWKLRIAFSWDEDPSSTEAITLRFGPLNNIPERKINKQKNKISLKLSQVYSKVDKARFSFDAVPKKVWAMTNL